MHDTRRPFALLSTALSYLIDVEKNQKQREFLENLHLELAGSIREVESTLDELINLSEQPVSNNLSCFLQDIIAYWLNETPWPKRPIDIEYQLESQVVQVPFLSFVKSLDFILKFIKFSKINLKKIYFYSGDSNKSNYMSLFLKVSFADKKPVLTEEGLCFSNIFLWAFNIFVKQIFKIPPKIFTDDQELRIEFFLPLSQENCLQSFDKLPSSTNVVMEATNKGCYRMSPHQLIREVNQTDGHPLILLLFSRLFYREVYREILNTNQKLVDMFNIKICESLNDAEAYLTAYPSPSKVFIDEEFVDYPKGENLSFFENFQTKIFVMTNFHVKIKNNHWILLPKPLSFRLWICHMSSVH